MVELPPELTLSRAAIFTSTRLRLRVASPPWMRVGLEMTSLPRVAVELEASEMGKQQSNLSSEEVEVSYKLQNLKTKQPKP